jgi:hypothetical protein
VPNQSGIGQSRKLLELLHKDQPVVLLNGITLNHTDQPADSPFLFNARRMSSFIG